MIPSEDPDYGDLGQAFPAWTGPGRDAILQPPKPEIRPSARVLERVLDRDADMEAGRLTARVASAICCLHRRICLAVHVFLINAYGCYPDTYGS